MDHYAKIDEGIALETRDSDADASSWATGDEFGRIVYCSGGVSVGDRVVDIDDDGCGEVEE